MKKIVRTIWISVLTGLAMLVACDTQHRIKRTEKKQFEENTVAELENIPEKPRLPDSVVRQLNKERDILCYEISVIRSSSYYNNKRQPTYSRKAFADERNRLERIYEIDLELENGKADSTFAVLDSIRRYSAPSTVYGPPR